MTFRIRVAVASALRWVAKTLRKIAFKFDPAWQVDELERAYGKYYDNGEERPLSDFMGTCRCGGTFNTLYGWRRGSLGTRHPSVYLLYCSHQCAVRFKQVERAS